MTDRHVEQQDPGAVAYPDLDLDVSYFPSFWHIFRVSHLAETDIDRICRPHGLSIADIQLLGAVWMDKSNQQRATDLAHTLHVSNAVLSIRIARLERRGFLVCIPSKTDRRAVNLNLTPEGKAAFETAGADIDKFGKFVRCFRRLSEQDRADLERIMGDLHTQLD